MKKARKPYVYKSDAEPAFQRERSLSKSERYLLIAEIAGARQQAMTFIDDAFRRNWNDR